MNYSIYYLTLDDIKYIFTELDSFFKRHNDPVPEFNSSYHHKIDSVLARPRDTFDGKDLYDDMFKKASCYFYFINVLHPFMNGNKRMSIVSTYVFLRMNGYIFEAEEDEVYDFAKFISDGHKDQADTFDKVTNFIKEHTRRESFIINWDISTILKRFVMLYKKG